MCQISKHKFKDMNNATAQDSDVPTMEQKEILVLVLQTTLPNWHDCLLLGLYASFGLSIVLCLTLFIQFLSYRGLFENTLECVIYSRIITNQSLKSSKDQLNHKIITCD